MIKEGVIYFTLAPFLEKSVIRIYNTYLMNTYNWSYEKDQQLQRERGITFFDVVEAVKNGRLLDDTSLPNQNSYSHQRILVVEIEGYAHIVPYVVEDSGTWFLKTIYPSREATKKYL